MPDSQQYAFTAVSDQDWRGSCLKELNTYQAKKNDDIFQIINQSKVLRVLLWIRHAHLLNPWNHNGMGQWISRIGIVKSAR